MNDRNVTALLSVLMLAKRVRWNASRGRWEESDSPTNLDVGDLARFLAHAGILAPQALTDEDVGERLGLLGSWSLIPGELARIAKGEA